MGVPDRHVPLPKLDTQRGLFRAVNHKPAFKILVQQGYYDPAALLLTTKYMMGYLAIDKTLKRNIWLECHDAGPMMYLRRSAREIYAEPGGLLAEANSELRC